VHGSELARYVAYRLAVTARALRFHTSFLVFTVVCLSSLFFADGLRSSFEHFLDAQWNPSEALKI